MQLTIGDLPEVVWVSVVRLPYSIRFLSNSMTPLKSLFIRRFIVWFPICCLATSFIMQTHVVFDCSRQTVDEDLEFDDSSELSEVLESPLMTNNLNSPLNSGSIAEAQPQNAGDPPPQRPFEPPLQGRRRPPQPSERNHLQSPDSWIDLAAPETPPDERQPENDGHDRPN